MTLRFALLACAALLVVAGTGAARAQPTFTVHTVRVTAKEYRFAL